MSVVVRPVPPFFRPPLDRAATVCTRRIVPLVVASMLSAWLANHLPDALGIPLDADQHTAAMADRTLASIALALGGWLSVGPLLLAHSFVRRGRARAYLLFAWCALDLAAYASAVWPIDPLFRITLNLVPEQTSAPWVLLEGFLVGLPLFLLEARWVAGVLRRHLPLLRRRPARPAATRAGPRLLVLGLPIGLILFLGAVADLVVTVTGTVGLVMLFPLLLSLLLGEEASILEAALPGVGSLFTLGAVAGFLWGTVPRMVSGVGLLHLGWAALRGGDVRSAARRWAAASLLARLALALMFAVGAGMDARSAAWLVQNLAMAPLLAICGPLLVVGLALSPRSTLATRPVPAAGLVPTPPR